MYKDISELPAAFKNLSDAQKEKALAMLNAMLKKDMDEGIAIATTLKRVQKMDLSDPLPTVDLDGIEIARTGAVTDSRGRKITLTQKDFDEAEQSWNEIGDRVIKAPVDITLPYKLWAGHDSSQPILASDGMIAGGWVTNVRREGKKLLADFKKVPRKIGKLIEAGAWRTVSIGLRPLYEFEGKTYRNVLDHVALLGKKPPAIKNMDDLMALYSSGDDDAMLALLSDDDMTVIVLSEDDGTPTGKEGKAMDKLLKMLREKLELAEDASEDDVIAAFAEFDKGAVELAEQVKTLKDEVEALKTTDAGKVQLAEQQYNDLMELAELGRKAFDTLARKNVEEIVDKAIKERKIAPAQREDYIALAAANEEKVVALFAGMSPIPGLSGEVGSDHKGTEKIELTDSERKIAMRMGVSEDALMKVKDPETFARIEEQRNAEE